MMKEIRELPAFLLGFAPWILFLALSGPTLPALERAILVCLAASVTLGFGELRRGYILQWGTLVFFAACAVLVNVFKVVWVARNMEIMDRLREESGAKTLLALKCFATWPVFDQMRQHMDGTTSSSLYELRLGREKFGRETHAYSVGWSDHEIAEAVGYADKIIFNSIGQLERFDNQSAQIERGLRLNPRFSTSGFDLADPARPFSRLGEWDQARIETVMDRISGFMIHYNCENADFDLFDRQLSRIEDEFDFPAPQPVPACGGMVEIDI